MRTLSTIVGTPSVNALLPDGWLGLRLTSTVTDVTGSHRPPSASLSNPQERERMLSSTNLKRSAAALGVVAGLLAAAVPASAQLPATTVGVTAPPPSLKAPAAVASAWHQSVLEGQLVKAPANTTSVVFTSVSNVFKGEVIGLEPNALGTQVGSEGVKAPAKTLPTWTEGNNQPSGDNLRGEAIDIIP